jgi:predicted amidohydrolase
MENQAFVLGVNRVGEGGGLLYAGDSALLDPMGEAISSASTQPGVVVGDVTAEAVADVRARLSFLADRRPAVYERLARRREGGEGA